MNEVTVIGSTSPFGIDLVSEMAASGWTITAHCRTHGRIPSEWLDHPGVTPVSIDLSLPLNSAVPADLLKKNIVWLAHLDQGRFNEREVEMNAAAFSRFLDLAGNSQVERIVFVSSGGSVYGETANLPIDEDHARRPLSSYGKAKAAMEDLLTEFGAASGIKTAILRPGNIYGFSDPNNDNKGIVAAFLNSAESRTPFTLIHEGRTVRDFIHINDVIASIIAALDRSEAATLWNVATGTGTPVANVLKMIVEQGGISMPEIENIKNYASDVDVNVLSINQIMNESGWRPTVTLEDGIRKFLGSRGRGT